MRYDEATGLIYNEEEGVAYQRDHQPFVYDAEYAEHYRALEGTEIAIKLNAFRVGLLIERGIKTVLDVGVGAGTFLQMCESLDIKCYGYDVCKPVVYWLRALELYIDPTGDAQGFLPASKTKEGIEAWTCWDSLEHMAKPGDFLDFAPQGCWLFASLPIFDKLSDVATSKHFKPNEHLWYFTRDGFIKMLEWCGYKVHSVSNGEVTCGREGIETFVAQKHRI